MEVKDILTKVKSLNIPNEGYRLFDVDEEKFYFGKSSNGNVVFVIESTNNKLKSFVQETKKLYYFFNLNANFIINDHVNNKTVHLLECKNADVDMVEAFVRLTQAFALNSFSADQYYLTKLFTALTSLFAKEKRASESELQGLYAELYAILYLKENGCDISSFWQSKDKMKFDFSINGNKRIEVKSTIKPNRIHRFRHEQLLSDLYDIKVISLMLQKNDCGLSLRCLINKVYDTFNTNMPMLLHIEQLIRNVQEQELQELKYDEVFTKNNIRFYNAEDIPHFEDVNPDGISNAEYDCDLTGSPTLTIDEFKIFINQS